MLKRKLCIIFIALISTSLIGCELNEFNSADSLNGQLDGPIVDQQACEAPVSKYQLNTEIVSLEIESRRRGLFGFAKNLLRAFGLNFDIKRQSLRLEMNINDSINNNKFLAHGSGSALKKDSNFDFRFDFGQLSGGFTSFSSTPLAELTSEGLNSTLNDLVIDFQNNSEEWSTTVNDVIEMENSSTEILINSGAASNLKPGDVLAFYNRIHRWDGTPCNSNYRGAIRTSREPIAFGTVSVVKNHTAQLSIEAAEGTVEKIELGAEGIVHKLNNGRNRRSLRQSIRINTIKNSNLEFEESKRLDIAAYMKRQIRGLAADKGFVIYND